MKKFIALIYHIFIMKRRQKLINRRPQTARE